MTAPAPVIVLGDLMTDVVTRTSGRVSIGSDTTANIALRGGGSGANVAAWLGAAGHPVSFVGRVGNDAFGRVALEQLIAVGVLPHIAVDPQLSTGTCVVLVAPDGERSMLPDAGANATLSPADLPRGIFVTGAHLHLSGYTLLRPSTRPAALAAMELAHRSGMTASVDPASSAPLRLVGPERVLSWLQGVQVLLPNLDELHVLTTSTDGSLSEQPGPLAARLAERLGALVVATCGAAGAVAATPEGTHVEQSAPTVDVVDATGCGDAFAASFLRHWLQGQPLEQVLTQATQAGSRCATLVGGRPAGPDG